MGNTSNSKRKIANKAITTVSTKALTNAPVAKLEFPCGIVIAMNILRGCKSLRIMSKSGEIINSQFIMRKCYQCSVGSLVSSISSLYTIITNWIHG